MDNKTIDHISMCCCPICSTYPVIKHILPFASRFISSSVACPQCGLNIVSEQYFDNKENRDKFDRRIAEIWNRMGVAECTSQCKIKNAELDALVTSLSLMRRIYSCAEITGRGDFNILQSKYPDVVSDLLNQTGKLERVVASNIMPQP